MESGQHGLVIATGSSGGKKGKKKIFPPESWCALLRISHTSPVDEEHEFFAEIPGVGPLLECFHDEVGGRVWEVLVESQHHVEEGIGQLLFLVLCRRALDGVQQENHVICVPLVWGTRRKKKKKRIKRLSSQKA